MAHERVASHSIGSPWRRPLRVGTTGAARRRSRSGPLVSYPLLSSPIRIAGLDMPNRTVMSPMSSGLGYEDGSVSPAQIAFYRERAEGGVGLIIVEFTCVN